MADNEELLIKIDDGARSDIAAELGSVNVFIDRLGLLVENESGSRASVVSEASDEAQEGGATRGAGIIAIITAVAGLITSLSPIVIAWIRSRGLEVEEKIEQQKNGKIVHTLRVRRGAQR